MRFSLVLKAICSRTDLQVFEERRLRGIRHLAEAALHGLGVRVRGPRLGCLALPLGFPHLVETCVTGIRANHRRILDLSIAAESQPSYRVPYTFSLQGIFQTMDL